jgi:hypothetical protein
VPEAHIPYADSACHPHEGEMGAAISGGSAFIEPRLTTSASQTAQKARSGSARSSLIAYRALKSKLEVRGHLTISPMSFSRRKIGPAQIIRMACIHKDDRSLPLSVGNLPIAADQLILLFCWN